MPVLVSEPVGWTDVLSALTSSAAVLVAVAVAVIESWRARKARAERDEVIAAQRAAEHRATARLVSAWAEQGFQPSEAGTEYVRHVVAHIVNGSDQPVFQVSSSVVLTASSPDGPQPLVLGPLSMPPLIPVLPPHRELLFDLTLALLAHRTDNQGAAPDTPGVEIGFTDPNDIRWVRESDGRLVESTREVGKLFAAVDDELVQRQLGRMDPYNPMAVTLAFLSAITDEDRSDREALRQLKDTLAPEAKGWRVLDADLLAELRSELHDYRLGSHVWYPVPGVAYVRILESDVTELSLVVGEGVVLPTKVVTLTFNPERGWRVFAYGGGGTEPDQIYFANGAL